MKPVVVLLVALITLATASVAEIIPLQLDRKGVKDSDQVVYGVDAGSGTIAWEHRFPKEANFAKAVKGGILVGCDDGALYLLDATTGSVTWKVQLGEKDEKVNVFHGASGDGWLVSYHNNVYWLVSPKGELIWALR